MKNCDRGLENAARGRRPRTAFSSRGHSFSLYGPTLSRQITYLSFPAVNWLTSGFVYAALSLNRLTCRRSTEPFVKTSNGRTSK